MKNIVQQGWRGRLRKFVSRLQEKGYSREELEAFLYETDFSPSLVARLLDAADRTSAKALEEVLEALQQEVVSIIQGMDISEKPDVPTPGAILLLGVNGTGKTTTAAKLAARYKAEGRAVVLAAADTFRAGAIEQLKLWGERVNAPVIAQGNGSDPAAVIFDAWTKAVADSAILIADTAGRLHTRTPLIEELKKIERVLSRDGRGAPHESYLVLDGTTGQNAIIQSKEFLKAVNITGLVITKLDGTARGGAALTASLELNLPIRYIGLGEGVEDLKEFQPEDFAAHLFRL